MENHSGKTNSFQILLYIGVIRIKIPNYGEFCLLLGNFHKGFQKIGDSLQFFYSADVNKLYWTIYLRCV